jgi:hypothetical protein
MDFTFISRKKASETNKPKNELPDSGIYANLMCLKTGA